MPACCLPRRGEVCGDILMGRSSRRPIRQLLPHRLEPGSEVADSLHSVPDLSDILRFGDQEPHWMHHPVTPVWQRVERFRLLNPTAQRVGEPLDALDNPEQLREVSTLLRFATSHEPRTRT